MSDEQDGPIEIELTAHAPKRSRRRGPAPEAADGNVTTGASAIEARETAPGVLGAPSAHSEPPSGWLESERSRLLMTASAVAVVALLIGWMLGRSDGESTPLSDDVAATTPSATSVPEPDEPDPAFEGAEELPDTDVDVDEILTTTTVAPPTTTPPTTAAQTQLEAEPIEIAFDERLLGRDMTLIAVDRERRLLEIDLATGDVTQRGEPLPSGVERLFAGSDWVAMALQGSGRLLVEREDGLRTEASGFDWWNLVVDTERGVIWGIGSPSGPTLGTYEEYELTGEPTGRSVELPEDGWSAVYDDGAFLATVIGSTYRIDPDGHELVTSGQILAASTSTLVLNNCDDELRCGLRIVERETGEERWLPPGPGQEDRRFFPFQWYYGSQSGGSLSPDGRWMLAVVPNQTSQDAGVIDLETGEFVKLDVLGVDGFGAAFAWSPDSRLVFFVVNRIPWVHDLESGQSFRLSPDQLSWSGLAVRPG